MNAGAWQVARAGTAASMLAHWFSEAHCGPSPLAGEGGGEGSPAKTLSVVDAEIVFVLPKECAVWHPSP